jgi:DNA-binding MarR family transcriptional regulator
MMGKPEQILVEIRRDPIAPVSDSALSSLIGYNLKRSFNGIYLDLAEVLRPLGLRMITFTILTMLKENPGIRLSNLAAAIDMEKPNMVSVIDELSSRALVLRSADPHDRRARQLHLTAAGEALQRQAYEQVCEHEERFLQHLDGDERAQLVALLSKIRRGIGQEPKPL